ncbi:MAG: SIMPL domain-containing protein [Bacteroidales bacterium]|jgi:uncharacterized protein YggE|nr:SIMPL domain-containing protein [Bacteroidales bacterium]
MKNTLPFWFCILFVFPFFSFAQNEIENTPYIEVTGNAQLEIIPDIINVQIVLNEYYDGNFKVTINEQEAKMKNMLRIVGVDLSKLNLLNENADNVTITKKEKEITNNKTFIVTLSNVSMLTSIFQVLNDLNIKDTKFVSATHSKMDSLRLVVKRNAIIDAKEQATFILSAIGNTLGEPLIIKENIYADKNKTSTDSERNFEIIDNEYVLGFKKIKIQCSIYARFAIE